MTLRVTWFQESWQLDSSFHFAKALTSSTMLAGNADVVYVVAGVLYFKIITVNLIIGNNYIFKVN